MSSRKRAPAKNASAKSARRPRPARPVARPAAKPANGSSAEAAQLAALMERALADGRTDLLSPEAVQTLMAALCRTYAAQNEGGEKFMPLPKRSAVSPTDIMVTASGLLKSANLAVFELGMWQSWTGR
jgi:hypothetical protein